MDLGLSDFEVNPATDPEKLVDRVPSTAYLDIFDFLRTFRKELLRISVPVHRFRTRVQPSSQVNGKCDLDVSSLTA